MTEALSMSIRSCWAFIYAVLFLMTNPIYFHFLFYSMFDYFWSFLSSPLRLLGNIKNTEPLDSKHQRVYTFWVTAFDCGKNRAQADAQVVVTVKPSCKPGWIGNKCHRLLSFWYGCHPLINLCKASEMF